MSQWYSADHRKRVLRQHTFGGDQHIPGWESVDLANGPAYFPKTSGLSVN